jgi:signal transduction histidine kinase
MFINDAYNDPSALKQISSMIERHNQLVEEINSIESLQKSKEEKIEQLKSDITHELTFLRTRVSDIKELVEKAEKYKLSISKDFKRIIKTDSFNRLSRRIDNLNFENRMSRSEFYRVLER